jgi:WD40 repeat protein
LARDLDEGIRVGEDWKERLYEELRAADALVCLITAKYAESPWCAAELGIADSSGMKILPVRAEPYAEHRLVTTIQYADLAADPEQARLELVGALRRLDAGGPGGPEAGSPYPGLRPFEARMARLFFGRTAETRRLAERLRAPAGRGEAGLLVVVGPSGSGKSSLVRAGLDPVVSSDPDWLALPPLVPGRDPIAALARVFLTTSRALELGWSLSDIETALREADGLDRLATELTAAATRPAHRLLLVVDQAEELVTRTDPAARERFAATLRGAASGPVRTVATLRSDFLDPVLELAARVGLPVSTFPLPPLNRDMLPVVITEPARRAGLTVGDELVARLVADTGSGQALPLLAFVLSQLAAEVGRGGTLSAERYDALGGVHGALTRQADAALAAACAASGRTEADVLAGMLRLVTVDGDEHATRRQLDYGTLPAQVRAELDEFVDARLLTIDTDRGRPVISVAHDKVLTAWAPLAMAISQAVDELRLRRTVEDAASEWDRSGRPVDHLWDRARILTALRTLGRSDLTATEAAFLDAGRRHGERRRRRATAVLSVLLLLISAGAALALTQWRIAANQREAARSAQRAALASGLMARADALRGSDSRAALRLGIAAARIAPGNQTQASLLETVTSIPNLQTTLLGHTERVRSVAFAPDGRTLATGSADNTVLLWDVTNPANPHQLGGPLRGHSEQVWSVAFAPDSRTLATGSADNTVLLWDVTNPANPHQLGGPLAGHAAGVWSVAFAPDGRTLATGSADHTVLLWDVTEPANPHRLGGPFGSHTGEVWSVAFAPDSRTLASGGADSRVLLWDVSDRNNARRLAAPLYSDDNAPVNAVAFAPGGDTLAIGSDNNAVTRWDVTDPATPYRLTDSFRGHTDQVNAVAFAPDGKTLATGSNDSTVILWDLTGRYAPVSPVGAPLRGHTKEVNAVAFSPDGHTLVSAGDDDQAVLWDVTDPAHARQYRTPLRGHKNTIGSVALTPDGRTLATGSPDRTAILWDVSDPAHPRQLGQPLRGHISWIWCLAVSPDGRTLATGSADTTVLLWDITDREHPHRLGQPLRGHTDPVGSVAFSSDGRTLATGATGRTDKSVILWDITDPAHPRRLGAPLRGHTDAVNSVAFSPDGHTLATGSEDKSVILWDVTDRKNARRLARPLVGHTGRVTSVAFSPDGHTLATGSTDRTAILWDLADREAPRRIGAPLKGHTDEIWSVRFSPDGRTLATGSTDKTVILWDLRSLQAPPAEVVRRACAQAAGGLSRDEWARFIRSLPYEDTCRR